VSLASTMRASILLTALAGFVPAAHAQSPIIIDYPGASSNATYGFAGTTVVGINNNEEIVGAYYDAENNEHGFSYQAGAFSPPINGGETWTNAAGVTDSGVIVGSTYLNPRITYDAVGYVDDGGMISGFGSPNTEIERISSDGAYIVGYHFIASTTTYQSFLYSGGAFTALQDPSLTSIVALGVNTSGQIVGLAKTGTSTHGFVYKDGAFTLLDFPGASSTYAEGINDSGFIVGSYTNASGYHGFLYNAGNFNSFDIPGAILLAASGINNSGVVVGSYWDAQRVLHGFLYPTGAQGYVNTKYLIMGVTYAPPGGSASSVSYQNTSILGNTSTITKSFTNNVGVTISASQSFSLFGAAEGKTTETFSAGWTQKTTNSTFGYGKQDEPNHPKDIGSTECLQSGRPRLRHHLAMAESSGSFYAP
jgi:probable HAF family extracellular repeat protein